MIEQANWDTSKTREKLQRDIDAHIDSVRAAKLSELTTVYEVNRLHNFFPAKAKLVGWIICHQIVGISISNFPNRIVLLQSKLNEALAGPVEALLDGANDETWPTIRKLLKREAELAVFGLSNALSGFEMDEETRNKMLTDIENYAQGVVEGKAKEEAGRVLMRMKDR